MNSRSIVQSEKNFKNIIFYLFISLKSVNIDININTVKKVIIQEDLEGHERLYYIV